MSAQIRNPIRLGWKHRPKQVGETDGHGDGSKKHQNKPASDHGSECYWMGDTAYAACREGSQSLWWNRQYLIAALAADHPLTIMMSRISMNCAAQAARVSDASDDVRRQQPTLKPAPHVFTRFPDAADLPMAAMTSWRRTASAKSGTVCVPLSMSAANAA